MPPPSPTPATRWHAVDPWTALSAELDLWQAAGRTATVWWRDDDAVQPSANLDRLLDQAGRYDLPVALAVVPRDATPALAERLAVVDEVAVLQHGWAHINHAGRDEKKMELGDHRPVGQMLDELKRGFERLAGLFGTRFRRVLVPPWNRIGRTIGPTLAKAGYRGLSLFGPRDSSTRHGLTLANTHVDPIAWRTGRGFAGTDRTLAALTDHLAQRRKRDVDADEPTGLLTHHLVHDTKTWAFLDRCLDLLAQHPGARLLPAHDVFANAGLR